MVVVVVGHLGHGLADSARVRELLEDALVFGERAVVESGLSGRADRGAGLLLVALGDAELTLAAQLARLQVHQPRVDADRAVVVFLFACDVAKLEERVVDELAGGEFTLQRQAHLSGQFEFIHLEVDLPELHVSFFEEPAAEPPRVGDGSHYVERLAVVSRLVPAYAGVRECLGPLFGVGIVFARGRFEVPARRVERAVAREQVVAKLHVGVEPHATARVALDDVAIDLQPLFDLILSHARLGRLQQPPRRAVLDDRAALGAGRVLGRRLAGGCLGKTERLACQQHEKRTE